MLLCPSLQRCEQTKQEFLLHKYIESLNTEVKELKESKKSKMVFTDSHTSACQ
jgi:hypothetical protein